MSINPGMMSSNKHDWGTPWPLFDVLEAEHDLTLDVCATAENAKCKDYFSPEDNGLEKAWYGNCFMNPPYGKEIGKWVAKASSEATRGIKTVALLPARTDTAWFHKFIYRKRRVSIEFLKGRIRFLDRDGTPLDPAPFPSMIVVFKPNGRKA